jgi:hypothetical protein
MDEVPQDSSNVAPLGLLFLLCMVFLTLSLPRRFALIPLLITTCYMPLGQMFVIAGLHFQFIRILLLVSWCRVFMRGEVRGLRIGPLDKIFIYWALATLVLGTLTQPSFERFTNRSGEIYNAVGSFFLIRCWVRDLDDVIRVVRIMSLMIVPLALSMVVEKFTGRNLFALFGGVPEITVEREGQLRCQGAFRHPILAGTYGATCFSFFVGLWFQKGRNKLHAAIGVFGSVVVTIAAASSGSLLALISSGVGLSLWPLRHRMRMFRWAIVAILVVLSLVMKAPVWYVFAKLSDVAGGTGWYRSFIIEQAINHFNEWWLVGSTYTAHWAPGGEVMAGNPGNMDIINNYVSEGLGGGIVKLGLFIAMIVACYKVIGQLVCTPNFLSLGQRIFIWSLGVCLTSHCISFFSVVYFDQIVVMWYWILAVITMLSDRYILPKPGLQRGERAGNAVVKDTTRMVNPPQGASYGKSGLAMNVLTG